MISMLMAVKLTARKQKPSGFQKKWNKIVVKSIVKFNIL